MNIVHTLTLIIVVAAAAYGQAEDHTAKNLQRYDHFFQKHGVSLDRYAFDDAAINGHLKKAIRHHRQQRALFVTGGFLFVSGVLLMLSSAGSQPGGVHSSRSLSHVVNSSIKSDFRRAGFTSLGASVPILFIGSNQRYKRDKAIEEAQLLLK